MTDILASLMRWSFDPAHIECGCLFVSDEMYLHVNETMFFRGRKEGFVNHCLQTLNDAGIPNLLALGYWVVRESHRADALKALKGIE